MNELDMLLSGLDEPGDVMTEGTSSVSEPVQPPAPPPPPPPSQAPAAQPMTSWPERQREVPSEQASMAARVAAERLEQEESFRAPFQEEDYQLTDEQRAWLKDGNVGDVIGRLARAEINKGAERLNREYEARLNEERSRVARLEEQLRQTGQQSFESQLASQVPDLSALMGDPSFQAFLQEPADDPSSPYPVTRNALMARAFEARNVSYLARSVAEFRARQRSTNGEAEGESMMAPRPSRQPAQGYSTTPSDAPQSVGAQQARLRQQMAQYQQKLDDAVRSGRIKNPKVYDEFMKTERMLRERAQQMNLSTF